MTDKGTGALRPVTPGDIVILLRSPKTKARTFIAALEQQGVSASAEERGGCWKPPRWGAVVSLLNVIDNPRQDVDLIGALRSPLFGFTRAGTGGYPSDRPQGKLLRRAGAVARRFSEG